MDDQNQTGTTGVRKPGSKINILVKGRMLIDILRTLSHEWVHEYQTQEMGVDEKKKIQDIGGPEENMSNVLSGIFIKKFDKQNPDFKERLYEGKKEENQLEKEVDEFQRVVSTCQEKRVSIFPL
jgi:predicted RNase H-like nuclease (RuvC/YqgF family)